MKLELDINSAPNSSFENNADHLTNSENKTDEVKKMLRLGINLAKEGSRTEARQMLLKVTEAEPGNETAWLWLASISEYPEELLIFLQNVLKVNPNNERALEWAKQTKTLLSKTFVQRGINASRDNQKEFAKQCFLQGIVHDDGNEMAWLWLASTSDSPEEKLSHLQKVLQLNPHNETALSSLNAVRSQISQSLLKKANSAAIAGDRETSKQILETIMKHTPNLEEAWILKAYLADEYYEKIQAYQKALEINPESEAGQAGLASLQVMAQKAAKPAVQPVVEEQAEPELAGNEWAEPQAQAEPVEVQAENQESVEVQAENQETVEERVEVEPPVQEPTTAEDDTVPAVVETQDETVEMVVETVVSEEFVDERFADEQVVTETAFAEEFQSEPENWSPVEPAAEVEEEVVAQESLSPVEPVEAEHNFVRPNPPFVVEETMTDETLAETGTEISVVEDENSPTQELDEEFARTADAVFNSYQEPETAVDEEAYFEPSATENPNAVAEYEAQPVEAADEDAPVYRTDELPVVDDPQAVAEAVAENAPQNLYENEVEAQPEEIRVVEETEVTSPQAEESYAYRTPYFSDNGFEVVTTNEPFADYQQPTVELSSAEFSELAAPDNEYFEHQREKTELTESYPAEAVEPFEPQTEVSTNGYAKETVDEVPAQEEHAAFVDEAPATEHIPAVAETYIAEQAPAVAAVQPQAAVHFAVQPQLKACPFCHFENEAQTIVCHSCQSMLSLSDLEMMLAHQDAHQDLLLGSIERMEVERTVRDFSVDELTTLGIAYLNARNLRKGFAYLREAAQLNPNDVVLGSKVNFLAIRLNEIEEHDNKAQENPFQSRTILVVDDSPTVRKLISGKLEKSGHSVISAIDGMDALAKINEVIPDLILLDITMPRLDGYQVCKLIRNNEVTKEIPIIMISGKDGFFDKVRGRMAGSTGYITKPFGPDTLMKTIETYLG